MEFATDIYKISEYFDVICIEEYTTLTGDGKPFIIKKGTIYTICQFGGDYKIKDEDSFIHNDQYENYYMPLKDYRENQINDILE